MRILFITHNSFPQPTKNGSAIHIWTLMNSMQQNGHQVNLLIYGVSDFSPVSGWLNPDKELLVKNLESTGIHVHILTKKREAEINRLVTKSSSILRAFTRLIRPEPSDFYEGPFYREEILAYAELIKTDIIVAYSFEAVSAACALQGKFPIVASTVDLDHIIRRLRQSNPSAINLKVIASYFYSRILLSRLPLVEVNLLNQCNLVYNHAFQHCQWLQKKGVRKASYLPVAVPDAAGSLLGKTKSINNPLRMIMVGDVAATVTRFGIQYLTQNILPKLNAIWQKGKSFELLIFGSGTVSEATKKQMNYEWVKIMGFVEDIGFEFYKSDILLVPNPDKVGFRTRIAEGFSFGCCVITHESNTLGMPELIDHENCLVCKTAEDFTEAIDNCLKAPEMRKKLSAAARLTYEQKFYGSDVAKKMLASMESIVQTPK